MPNFPKMDRVPAYPKGAKFPNADQNFDNNLKPQVGDTQGKPAAPSEVPVGAMMPDAVANRNPRGVNMGGDRDETPVETDQTISPRGGYVQSDLTQAKVMEKNDPTHDGKSFNNRSWEDKNFENRRLFY